MEIGTDSVTSKEFSEESLSDDDNLSSVSLLRTLVEQSETDVLFRKLSLNEKIMAMSSQIKGSYFKQRESLHYDDSYNKDIEEHMKWTKSDRMNSLRIFNVPKYSSADRGLDKTFLRPDPSEFRIPLMTRYSKPRKPSKRRSSSYVHKLLTSFDAERLSTIRLHKYKQKIMEDFSKSKERNDIGDEYTPQEKKMIDEILGDIPFRQESVYVPYGRLSYLRGLSNELGDEPNMIYTPPIGVTNLPSYDESQQQSKGQFKTRSYLSAERNTRGGSCMWERFPSNYEFTLNPNTERDSGEERTSKKVIFNECD